MNRLEASLLEKLFDADTPIRRAVLCTYGFDPEYFSEVIYPELRKRRCDRILVLMDAAQYQAISSAMQLSTTGHVVLERFPAGQLFHPKLFVLAGDGRARIAVGSANLTRDGFEKNWELFTTFNESEFDFGRLIDWLEIIAEQPGLGKSAVNILHETSGELRAARLGKPEAAPLPFVWNGLQGSRLWNQLNDATHGKKLKKAVLLSPYFEAPEAFDHGLLDSWLAQDIYVEIYASIDRAQSQTPRDEIEALTQKYPGRLKLFGLPTQGRLLHGKLLILMNRSQAWVLSGSANFTAAALKGPNVETALLLNLPRADVEDYLKRLLSGAHAIQPADLPIPQLPSPVIHGPRTVFLLAALLSLEKDCLTLELTCPWRDLTSDPKSLSVDLGGQSHQLDDTSFVSENRIVICPASKYLRLPDGTWQPGVVIFRSEDNTITDWRLIELDEGEVLEEDGLFSTKPLDFEMFLTTLFNPRRLGQVMVSSGDKVIQANDTKRAENLEDVEGELDRVYRLAIQLETHFGWVMTDPHTVHRWRSDWFRFYHLFSTELINWNSTMQSFLCKRVLERLEVCLSRDKIQARSWLLKDKDFTDTVRNLLQVASTGPGLEVPILLKSLPSEKL